MSDRIAGKAAVITGAANGIGKPTAERFAAEGARLVLGDIDGKAVAAFATALAESGTETAWVAGDLTQEAAARPLIEACLERFGRIDILVNNLGGARPAKVWEMAAETWDEVIRLNLRSLFLATKHASAAMVAQGSGAIVCLSSGAREGTPWSAYYAGNAPYSAAKAGVHGFIRDVAMELAEHGVRINAVAPGPIDTERVGAELRRLNDTVDLGPNRMTPLGRLGTPEEVANAILFLASDESSYVTGHTLAVAGGR